MAMMPQLGELILSLYAIERIFGIGGQCFAMQARDIQTRQEVFVKQLKISPGHAGHDQALARFQREATMHIASPHAVNPIASGEDTGRHFIVFPWVEGEDLDEYVRSFAGGLPIDNVLRVLLGLASALRAHGVGIVHRDIKSSNILIQADGEPRLIDFGIAKDTNDVTIASSDALLGTFACMAPEQIRDPGSEDHRTDLFALGTLLYFMLTGARTVRPASPAAIALSICEDTPIPPSSINAHVSPWLDAMCMKLLAKDRDHRVQSADALIDAVSQHIPGASTRRCRSCNHRIAPDQQYCAMCGANATPTGDTRCLACGAAADAESPACPHCQRQFSPANHRFHFRTGTEAGVVFRVPEGEYSIGRQEIAPRDSHVSRTHFHVACVNGTVWIHDAASANGTFMNGQSLLHSTALSSGTTVVVASSDALYTHNHERNTA